MHGTVFTIGHADRTVAQLLAMLHLHRINSVADVRWPPYSQLHPQFDRDALDVALHFQRIQYMFLGKELGPAYTSRSSSPNSGYAATAAFQQGVKRIQAALYHGRRVAILGVPKHPLSCHRGIFIAQHLVNQGVGVQHILDVKNVIDHVELQRRALTSLADVPVEPALIK